MNSGTISLRVMHLRTVQKKAIVISDVIYITLDISLTPKTINAVYLKKKILFILRSDSVSSKYLMHDIKKYLPVLYFDIKNHFLGIRKVCLGNNKPS